MIARLRQRLARWLRPAVGVPAADSPLWTTPASAGQHFAHMPVPPNLTALAERVSAQLKPELDARLRPYRTPLLIPVGVPCLRSGCAGRAPREGMLCDACWEVFDLEWQRLEAQRLEAHELAGQLCDWVAEAAGE